MKCSDDFRLDLLNLINDNRGLSRAGLLNLAGGNGRDTDAVIKNLIDEKLISYSGISYSLTHAGRETRLALQEERDNAAKLKADEDAEKRSVEASNRRDKRKDRLHDFAVAVFSAVLTLLIEYLIKLM